jgi:hypothetical protein
LTVGGSQVVRTSIYFWFNKFGNPPSQLRSGRIAAHTQGASATVINGLRQSGTLRRSRCPLHKEGVDRGPPAESWQEVNWCGRGRTSGRHGGRSCDRRSPAAGRDRCVNGHARQSAGGREKRSGDGAESENANATGGCGNGVKESGCESGGHAQQAPPSSARTAW